MSNHRGTENTENTKKEEGWALLTVLFFSAILVVMLASLTPRWAMEAQRDREADLMFRGKDYARAVQLYFRKFRRYPARMEELENTNQIRFLRRRWVDPITQSEEWRVLHMGPAGVLVDSVLQVPGTVQGAAGVPGAAGAGVPAPAGTIGGPGSPPLGGAGFGQPQSGFGQTQSGFGQPPRPGVGQTSGVGQPSGFGQPPPAAGGQQSFTQQPGLGVATGIPTTVGGTTSGFAPGQPGLGGITFGAGIAGVASKSEKKSIRVYNGRQKYNEWEFVYDFRRDPALTGQGVQGVGGVGGTPIQPGQPGFGQPGQPGFGQPRPGFGQPGQPGFGQPGTGGFPTPPRPPR